MEKLLRKHAQKIRYTFVGGFNTVLDFVLLFIFVALGVDKILANYFSTGVAMIVSFFANRSFTFKNIDTSASTKRQFLMFIGVTVVGMWVLQPIVIWTVTSTLYVYITHESALLFVAKLLATGVSFIWNYVMYSRYVFKKDIKTS